jgi:biopolymer transport protein ExbD
MDRERRASLRVEMSVAPQSGSGPRWVADPALIVVVIFTAVSALVTQPFWSLDVFAPSPATGARAPSPPVLHVSADRTLTLDGERVPVARLANEIQAVLAGRDQPLVYFDADDDTRYGYAARVIDQVRRAGGDPLLRHDASR